MLSISKVQYEVNPHPRPLSLEKGEGSEIAFPSPPKGGRPARDGQGARDEGAAWDLKAVRFIHDFMRGLTEPSMFPAYLAGGMTYRLLRWGAAGAWVASPAVKSLSGLFSRQLAASTVALGGEVAGFTGAQHAVREIFDLPVSHDIPLGKEMGGTALMLSSLRGFGFGAGLLGGMLQRAGLAGVGTASALSLAGSYTGLLTAQQAEHRLLHPDQPTIENPWLQAAVSLTHFTGFGLMARKITPRPWQTMEAQLEQRTHKIFSDKWRQIQNGLSPRLDAENLAWQAAGADVSNIPSVEGAKTTPSEGIQKTNVFAISGQGGTGGPSPKMIRIPGGKFPMGSKYIKDITDAKPVREVEVNDFLIGETPVTNAEYLAHVKARENEPFVLLETASNPGRTQVVDVGANPELMLPRYLHEGLSGWGQSLPLIQGGLTLLKVAQPNVPKGFDGPHQPVVNVDWFEALAYAAMYVKGGRLPTEAQWEYAARGPQGYKYGTRSGKLTKQEAHFDAHKTANVGSHPPNGYGLHDMTGNVWEWISDWYQPSYKGLPKQNPLGPAHGENKVLRGGAWFNNYPDPLRAVFRSYDPPDTRSYVVGFRVVAPVSQDSK